MNAARVFIDTNILIYIFSSDELDKKMKALEFLDDCQPVISTQILKEFSNVLLKKGKIMPINLKELLAEVIEISIVVNEETSLIIDSIDIHDRYKFSFYDSLIIATALSAECQILLSEDMQDGQLIEGRLKIFNPLVN